jgi:Family of unknown function (DUF6134)
MRCARCRVALACLIAVAGVIVYAGPARADDTEHRDYRILVDGKEAGQSRITMVEKTDGTTYVTASGQVNVRFFGFTAFSYKVQSQETWKGGQLVELRSDATENGTRTRVEVNRSGEQLHVTVNGSGKAMLNPEVWTSSYWKLADRKFHNNQVPVLDADTGNELLGKLEHLGNPKIPVAGQLEDCYHFRVSGIPVPIELWFDKHYRLVRQEFTESGHRTIVQLIAVRR